MTPPFGYLSLNRFTRVYGLLLIPYPADTQNRPIPILDGAGHVIQLLNVWRHLVRKYDCHRMGNHEVKNPTGASSL